MDQGKFLKCCPCQILVRYKLTKSINMSTTRWSGLGYGGFQGAMAYQGVVAFYYDRLRPNTAVELNVCRWNQVAADVIWRGPEWMNEHHLQCRDHPRTFLPDGTPDHASNTRCEDCRNTPIDAVKSVHTRLAKSHGSVKLRTRVCPGTKASRTAWKI